MSSRKLSLAAAIFTNINIMAGAGIFINTVILTKMTGVMGSFVYLLIGLFMYPLVKSIAQLVQKYPSGGFYSFAQPLSPLLGFISCWTYFFSKLASTSLVLYVSAIFLKQLFPNVLSIMPALPLSFIILALFTYLNLFNVEVGSLIQKIFFGAKTIPVVFVILLGLTHFSTGTISFQSTDIMHLATAIPLVLYCLAGFEATCAISRKIKDPQINGPKAIFYSFFILVSVYTIFQLLTSIMLIPNIQNVSSYGDAFPYLATLLNLTPWLTSKIANLLSICIVTSTLGGAYGMLFSNQWNLYTLAEHNHTFASKQITKLNEHEIPVWAVFIEALICIMYLALTQGSQIPLQQTAAFGAAIAYTISIIALLNKKISITPLLALITCSGFIISCIWSALQYGKNSLILFLCMFLGGIIMFWINSKTSNS